MEFFAKQQSPGSYENEILTAWWLLLCKKTHLETQGSQSRFHELNIYIYLLLIYNSTILDIEFSPYYIALGSTQTHKLI